jgi:neuronal cell adhesion molecule
MSSENGYGKAKVTWRPNFGGTPGSHFYAQYRKAGEPSYINSAPEISQDYIEVGGLEPNKEYEFLVVSVDGIFETPSAVQRFDTSGGGEKIILLILT